jgi:hypothetical protein
MLDLPLRFQAVFTYIHVVWQLDVAAFCRKSSTYTAEGNDVADLIHVRLCSIRAAQAAL